MTGFGGIVVGVETLDLSRAAISWAMREAAAEGCDVRLVHAVDWSRAANAALWGGYLRPEMEADEVLWGSKTELEAAVVHARASKPRVNVDGVVLEGDKVAALRTAARDAAMIVIGSRKLGAVRSLFGSTGMGLAHTSSVPFVVVRRSVEAPADAPIVVGVAPSASADGVLAAAFRFAAANRWRLRVVSCWEAFYYAPHDPAFRSTAGIREHAELWLAEAVAGWQEKYPDVAVERVLTYDYPASGLIEESDAAELLVVGIGGRRLARMAGSVAASVLHHAGCPVAVIPAQSGGGRQ